MQFADRVKKAIFERPTNNTDKKKTVDYEEYQRVLAELDTETNKRIELERLLMKLERSEG